MDLTKPILLLLFSMLFVGLAFADNVKEVVGESQIVGDDNTSPKELRRMALEAARQNALAKAFGTIVSQNIYQQETITSNKESSYTDFMSETEVKGEWIADVGEPEYRTDFDYDGNMVVYCKVRGKAKAISNEAVDFEVLTLRNCDTKQCQSTKFRVNDGLYMYFKAPVDGYLAVYLVDEDRIANNLLPYHADPQPIAKVKKNKEYVFFSEANPYSREIATDELRLTLPDGVDLERNMIYIVFSPNPFNKALDSYVSDQLPSQLPFSDFAKWLADMRRKDNKMNLKRIGIEISR